MAKRKLGGLGRGLEALLSVGDDEGREEPGTRVVYLRVEDIRPGRHQPRRGFDEEKLEELAASIREHGLVQPVVVRPTAEGGYELVAGERRWRASARAGLRVIPAVIRELSDRETMEVGLIENLQREDLEPLEEAAAYKTLIEEFNLTQEELAQRVGKSRSVITNSLRLLTLPAEVKRLLEAGELSAGHARALLGLEDEDTMVALAQEVARRGLSVRQTEELVRASKEKGLARSRLGEADRKEKEAADPVRMWLRNVEEQLREVLGTKVMIRGRGDRGRIIIEYFASEDLERIAEAIAGKCFT
ncbi:MAG: ParB/RepB/Spo0J family partition protein [Clostridia bacterium]|nr:ParB/RepB/Spo0J family partition protein [Clostridia bacterium]